MNGEIVIALPALISDGTAYLDIETRKVLMDQPYMADGIQPLRRRWSVIAAGVASGRTVRLFYGSDETDLLCGLATAVRGKTIAYSATREFDEMVLKGRFTNARRAHAPEPYFPAMPGANSYRWRNMAKEKAKPVPRWVRNVDCASRDVPELWLSNREVVLVHLLRDVCELVLMDDRATAPTRAWCRRALYSYDYAAGLVNG